MRTVTIMTLFRLTSSDLYCLKLDWVLRLGGLLVGIALVLIIIVLRGRVFVFHALFTSITGY